MSDATAPQPFNKEIPTDEEGKFRGYAKARADFLHVRLVVAACGALIIYIPHSWHFALITVIAVCLAEALDTISLNQSIKRLNSGAPLRPELRFSLYTAAFQALLFSGVVIGGAILQPRVTIDMFLICYLFAAVMNAGMLLYFNSAATYLRLLIYGITMILIISMRWMYFAGAPVLAYETAATLLLAYIAFRVIDFVENNFREQEQDKVNALSRQKSMKTQLEVYANKERHLLQLAAVAKHANDSVIVFDKTGRITWVNDAFTEITEYPRDEAIGRRAGTILNGPMTSPETVAKIEHAAATHSPLRIEIQYYTKSGDPIWVETNLVPLPSSPEMDGGMIAIERNITNSKLRQSELANAMRNAERSERAKSEFLATTSHEIRTPMNSIVGLTDLLSEHDLDPAAREYVVALQDSAQSLVRIVNDILDLSKLEAGKLKITPSVFEPGHFFNKLDNLMRPRAEAKGLSLSIDLPDDLPLLYADEGRIRQILVNLIDNAIKFTRSGGVTVAVQGARIANTCRFSVDVTDSGIGISESGMRRLFGYYAQAEDTTSQKYGGTGLGLAISRHLAREMGGDLTAVSHEGQGSCFSLFLPIACTDQSLEGIEEVTQIPEAPTANLAERTILVAEDNATNRMLMSKFLEKCGAEIVFAEDGQQAVDLFCAKQPDLILMDMQMPIFDGVEATSRIRALDAPQPYIVALTANAQKDDRDRCLKSGMDDFLTKPVRKVELLDTIYKVLADRPMMEKPLS
ncbi:response regulator [Donghicola sp. XS_ASV15]|uniref:hybrid sensor histidine kinase/response regulator n=1 Tax=Donghicola sp. XS_ASV15 TaxID=3241295 RepID=UPI003513AD71